MTSDLNSFKKVDDAFLTAKRSDIPRIKQIRRYSESVRPIVTPTSPTASNYSTVHEDMLDEEERRESSDVVNQAAHFDRLVVYLNLGMFPPQQLQMSGGLDLKPWRMDTPRKRSKNSFNVHPSIANMSMGYHESSLVAQPLFAHACGWRCPSSGLFVGSAGSTCPSREQYLPTTGNRGPTDSSLANKDLAKQSPVRTFWKYGSALPVSCGLDRRLLGN